MQVLILESTLPCFILIFPFLSLETADLDVLQVQMDMDMDILGIFYSYLPTYLSLYH